jgi:hypothetical protein
VKASSLPKIGFATLVAVVALSLWSVSCTPAPDPEGSAEPLGVAAVDSQHALADCRADADAVDPWPSGMPTFASGIGGWRLDHPMGGLETGPDGSCIYVGLGKQIGVVALDGQGLAHGLATVDLPGLVSAEGERVFQLRRVGAMLYAVTGRQRASSAAPNVLRVQQLDLADPARPRPTGLTIPGLPQGRVHQMVADGRWLYFGLEEEIALLDVRDPDRVEWGGRITRDSINPRTIAPSGVPGVFYSSRQEAVIYVDARDPDALDIHAVHEAPDGVNSLVWHEGYLYGAACFKRRNFFVLDARDPRAPVPLPIEESDKPEILGCFDVQLAMAGQRLLLHSALAGETYGALQAFHVSDPSRPVEIARAEAPGELLLSWLVAEDRVLWFEWQRGLKSTVLGDGPRWSTRLAMVVPEPFLSIAVERVVGQEEGAEAGAAGAELRWVAVGRDGLWTWRDGAPDDGPEEPRDWRRLPQGEPEGRVPPLGRSKSEGWPPQTTAWRTLLHEDHAYVAADEFGLRVIDLGAAGGPLAPPVARDTRPPIVATTDLALRDGVLFAADQGGLQVFDLRDPDRPDLLWHDEDPLLGGEHVVAIGPWAVVLGRERRRGRGRTAEQRPAHITVYDVSDPRRPRRAHEEQLSADPIGALNWGGRLVVGLNSAPSLRTYAIAADGVLHKLQDANPSLSQAAGPLPTSLHAGIDRAPGGLLLLYPHDGVFTIQSPMADEPARLMRGTAPGADDMWWRARWMGPAGRIALLGEFRTAVLRTSGW